MEIDEPGFHVSYDDERKVWTFAWKWAGDSEPDAVRNSVAEWHILPSAKTEYDVETEKWIASGWLKPYDEKKYGPVKGFDSSNDYENAV